LASFGCFVLNFAFAGSASPPADGPCVPQAMWEVAAFGLVAAFAFGVIVAIDLSVFLVKRYGYATDNAGTLGILHSVKTAGIIVFGAIGSFMVAVLAAMIGLFEINAQTAVVTGVTWQIAYATLLSRFREPAAAAAPATPTAPADTQAAVEEV